MPEVILPCPACGEQVRVVKFETLGGYIISHDMHGENRKCLLAMTLIMPDRDALVAAWNALPRMSTIIAWQLQAAGAALENQRLRAVLKSVEEIVLEAPELNMSNFDEDQIYSINEAMISICGILLQESARNDLEARNG